MVKKMWVSLIVYFTLFSWNSADENPFTMQYLEGDRAMLNCSDEYNETIQLSSVLYNYSTCSHGDEYGIQNLCDGHTACSFDVTNSNVGSSCGADGKASLEVSYNCNRSSTETRDCSEGDCFHCGDQEFYNSSLPLHTDISAGSGYLLIDPVNSVHCCGQIAMWHYVPVKIGNITFSVWRKIDINRYKVVGTNTVVVKDTDVKNQTTHNVPENERILINTGDIIGWHDGGDNIIHYYDCMPSMKSCPMMTLRTNMSSTNIGEEINVESLPQHSSRIYTMSYTSTVKGPPQFGMTPDSVTIGYRKSINSRVMDVQITDFGDFIHKIELDYDNEYFYFDTHLRNILVKKMLPPGQKITRHNYVLSVQDWCYNTATLNVTVTENIPPMIHGLPDKVTINPININPNLTTFTVDDPSDNVTCMINKTSPHTDMFIVSLHGNDASLILSENSSIDVNTASEYVIKISCTDGIDTTFFNLTLIFSTKDPAVTKKPNMQSDITLIIIGASIGGLFIIVVIIVVCVRKRQHKNNDENMANQKALELSNIGGSSDGATPSQYSRVEELDAIPHDNNGYVDVKLAQMKVRNDEKQPSTSEDCIYQTPWR